MTIFTSFAHSYFFYSIWSTSISISTPMANGFVLHSTISSPKSPTTTSFSRRCRSTMLKAERGQERDYSKMSIEELRKIANKKGYDTFGMDRIALETIAKGWSSAIVKVPSPPTNYAMEDEPMYISDMILDEEYDTTTKPDWIDTGKSTGKTTSTETPGRTNYVEQSPKSKLRGSRAIQPQQQQQRNKSGSTISQAQARFQLPTSTPQPSSQLSPYQQEQYNQQKSAPYQQEQYEQKRLPSSSSSPPPNSNSNNNDINNTTNNTTNNKDENFKQTVRSVLIGFLSGGVAISPVTYLHNTFFPAEVIANQMSQWEFDTFVGAIAAGSFAAVYRFFIRDDKDEMLSNGVVLAFVLARTFSRIRVSYYCQGLYCGAPLGFLDWSMLSQTLLSGVENIALFGAAALVMEYCYDRDIIDKPK